MVDVTVELADLETVVIATGALKTIESALQARKQDPFVVPHLNFTEAHNRLAEAMRGATRATADTLVPWDEPLESYERHFLETVANNEAHDIPTQVSPEFRLDHPEIDRLMCKGAIVLGQLVKGVLWAGKDWPVLVPDPSGFAIATTARGRSKLAKVANAA